MRVIISPAKKMRIDTDSMPTKGFPVFLDHSKELLSILQKMSMVELKQLWKCNDQIATLNFDRIQNMNLEQRLTPALFAYEGIQYQYMAPSVFSDSEFSYVQEHLRILSGFYGILKPFDGVTPYRLEMQTKLKIGSHLDLYSYWGSEIADSLLRETDCIVNLASKEYSQCVSKYIPSSVSFLTCIFGEEKVDKVIEKGTMCKMARGEMVRFMAENRLTDPAQLKNFNRLGYTFSTRYSDNDHYVFLKNKGGTHD